MTADKELDLDALREQALASRCKTVGSLYFGVLVPGDVLLELVERAECLRAVEREAGS